MKKRILAKSPKIDADRLVDRIADYMSTYVTLYRERYRQLTEVSPESPGYPAWPISPYLTSPIIDVVTTPQGVLVLFQHWGPDPEGGTTHGFSRMDVSPPWQGGDMPPSEYGERVRVENTAIQVNRYNLSLREIESYLFLGADLGLTDTAWWNPAGDYWQPMMLENVAFVDEVSTRMVRVVRLEYYPHKANAAWDKRSAWVRVAADIARDFQSYQVAGAQLSGEMNAQEHPAGRVRFPGRTVPMGPPFLDRIDRVVEVCRVFEQMLAENLPESAYHDFIHDHPFILDSHGFGISKPKFMFPQPSRHPTGKKYVEPDYVISYPDKTYRMIELERPDHPIFRRDSDQRAEVTHAVHQLGEWRRYVDVYGHLLEDDFPNIAGNYSCTIVIGRKSQEDMSPEVLDEAMATLRAQNQGVEVLTYDSLIERLKVSTYLFSQAYHSEPEESQETSEAE